MSKNILSDFNATLRSWSSYQTHPSLISHPNLHTHTHRPSSSPSHVFIKILIPMAIDSSVRSVHENRREKRSGLTVYSLPNLSRKNPSASPIFLLSKLNKQASDKYLWDFRARAWATPKETKVLTGKTNTNCSSRTNSTQRSHDPSHVTLRRGLLKDTQTDTHAVASERKASQMMMMMRNRNKFDLDVRWEQRS